MINQENNTITVEAIVDAPLKKVWECWTQPDHICQWNNASPDWHTPSATNDLQVGGEFHYLMAAKDGSFSFDFNGTYENILTESLIVYHIEGGRKVIINFKETGTGIQITETFEAEEVNSLDLQEMGWQSILNNFKQYTEATV
ncbi:MAG: SRPBCC domain-containing protein [Sediminibacterium sp.]